MSLIIAYRGRNSQYWCSDGLTVSMDGSELKVTGNSIRKIFQYKNLPVLIGCSGEIYDGDVIRKILGNLETSISLEEFLANISNIVKSINSIAEHYSLIEKRTRFETGLLIGGFLNQNDFLVIVTPDGKIIPMKIFAAIGQNSASFIDTIRTHSGSISNPKKLFDLFQICFKQYWDNSPIKNGPVFPIILKRSKIIDLYKYSLELFRSTPYENYINKMRKKVTFSMSPI